MKRKLLKNNKFSLDINNNFKLNTLNSGRSNQIMSYKKFRKSNVKKFNIKNKKSIKRKKNFSTQDPLVNNDMLNMILSSKKVNKHTKSDLSDFLKKNKKISQNNLIDILNKNWNNNSNNEKKNFNHNNIFKRSINHINKKSTLNINLESKKIMAEMKLKNFNKFQISKPIKPICNPKVIFKMKNNDNYLSKSIEIFDNIQKLNFNDYIINYYDSKVIRRKFDHRKNNDLKIYKKLNQFKIIVYVVYFSTIINKHLLDKISNKYNAIMNLHENDFLPSIDNLILDFKEIYNKFVLKHTYLNIDLDSITLDIFIIKNIVIDFLELYLNFLKNNYLNHPEKSLILILSNGFLPLSYLPKNYLNKYEYSYTKFSFTGCLSHTNKEEVFRMLIEGLLVIRILIFLFCFQSHNYLNEFNNTAKNINNLKTIGIILYNLYIENYKSLKIQNNEHVNEERKTKIKKNYNLTINGISDKNTFEKSPILNVPLKYKLRNEFGFKGFWIELNKNYLNFSKSIFKMIKYFHELEKEEINKDFEKYQKEINERLKNIYD